MTMSPSLWCNVKGVIEGITGFDAVTGDSLARFDFIKKKSGDFSTSSFTLFLLPEIALSIIFLAVFFEGVNSKIPTLYPRLSSNRALIESDTMSTILSFWTNRHCSPNFNLSR